MPGGSIQELSFNWVTRVYPLAAGCAAGFGVAMVTAMPSASPSEGFKMTWSDSESPWEIWSLLPRSRLITIFLISTFPSG